MPTDENQRFKTIRRVFGNVFNFKAWLDVDRTISVSRYLKQGVKHMFVPQHRAFENELNSKHAFDEQVKRWNLTEEELANRQKGLYRLSLTMLAFASLMIIYIVYQLFFGGILAVLFSLMLLCLSLALSFRYHFWYYQIKTRKLGSSVQDWFKNGLLGGTKR